MNTDKLLIIGGVINTLLLSFAVITSEYIGDRLFYTFSLIVFSFIAGSDFTKYKNGRKI